MVTRWHASSCARSRTRARARAGDRDRAGRQRTPVTPATPAGLAAPPPPIAPGPISALGSLAVRPVLTEKNWRCVARVPDIRGSDPSHVSENEKWYKALPH